MIDMKCLKVMKNNYYNFLFNNIINRIFYKL